MEKVGWAEAAVKDLQVVLENDNSTHNRHEDELTFFFDKLFLFQ